ncbi:hypothetical protein ABZ863_27310 [Saccharomonospora sp. NPDC046836]|uniref:hypothetical protein n=1 Tax=Saccharomonospora sp. NPDC046836 TaxID=3156921 RepID=UPI0033CB0646
MADIGSLIGDIFNTGRSPEQIYIDLTTGPGAETVAAASDGSAAQAELHGEIMDLIAQQHADVASGWQGEAGAGAANAATPVSRVAENAADQLQISHSMLAMQTDVFQHAKNSVVEVPENPSKAEFVTSAFPMLTDYAAKSAAYQEASENNKHVYEMYYSQSGLVGNTMPTDYSNLLANTDGMEITTTSATVESSGGRPANGIPAPGATYAGPPPSATAPAGGFVDPDGTHALRTRPAGRTVSAPAASAESDSTSSSGYVRPGSGGTTNPIGTGQGPGTTAPQVPGGGTPAQGTTGIGGGLYAPGTGSGPVTGRPGTGSDTVTGRPGTGSGTVTGRPGTGSGPVTARPGSGFAGVGSGAGASPGPGESARGTGGVLGGGRGTGAAPVSGPGGPAAAGAQQAATTGRGGPGGMVGPGAAGRGKNAEDQDHRRPDYLQEYDPHDVFVGELGRTAPPVIGEK